MRVCAPMRLLGAALIQTVIVGAVPFYTVCATIGGSAAAFFHSRTFRCHGAALGGIYPAPLLLLLLGVLIPRAYSSHFDLASLLPFISILFSPPALRHPRRLCSPALVFFISLFVMLF